MRRGGLGVGWDEGGNAGTAKMHKKGKQPRRSGFKDFPGIARGRGLHEKAAHIWRRAARAFLIAETKRGRGQNLMKISIQKKKYKNKAKAIGNQEGSNLALESRGRLKGGRGVRLLGIYRKQH